ncbi:hypothetical protein U128_03765 [Anaplasma marginale str. Gypsy Plains]|nr:hypothetical protein U128_03765 [Anaplasma marginale str. Gypsy Plains]
MLDGPVLAAGQYVLWLFTLVLYGTILQGAT